MSRVQREHGRQLPPQSGIPSNVHQRLSNMMLNKRQLKHIRLVAPRVLHDKRPHIHLPRNECQGCLLKKENCPALTSKANPEAPAAVLSSTDPKVENPRCSSLTYESVTVSLSLADSTTVMITKVRRARALEEIHEPVVLKEDAHTMLPVVS